MRDDPEFSTGYTETVGIEPKPFSFCFHICHSVFHFSRSVFTFVWKYKIDRDKCRNRCGTERTLHIYSCCCFVGLVGLRKLLLGCQACGGAEYQADEVRIRQKFKCDNWILFFGRTQLHPRASTGLRHVREYGWLGCWGTWSTRSLERQCSRWTTSPPLISARIPSITTEAST